MNVTINGVQYAPVYNSYARIGIAITTHNRANALSRALIQHLQFLPTGALVVVIDDGSKPAAVVPDGVQLLRHETSLGIVASKNASLSALMDAGCEHLFLWDDVVLCVLLASTRTDIVKLKSDTGNADAADDSAAAASSMTYCQAVLWIEPLLATIEKGNNNFSGIRDIENNRAMR
ncbi:hypothetical protein AI3057V1_1453 [Citrobacter freundii]|uniref:glycosyltransferase family 2 protein n=1 Tax=Citrobacter freundii TaxID=546 RepID=UPI001D9EA0D6|nr:hypothetical protein [Citrobacter freundii]CAG0338748.1 hypothetical protein AI3057V1_1453 [Citrobacter freundii]CAH6019166.1 hypothetical protein AI3057V1_1453 [Citrobacter freundii]